MNVCENERAGGGVVKTVHRVAWLINALSSVFVTDAFCHPTAPIKLPPEARRQGEAHEFELLDDIQVLR